MLRANRRHRLLYLALAGMDGATALPWLLVLLPATHLGSGVLTALTLFLLLWGATILFMAAADALNRRPWSTPVRAALLLLLVGGTTFAAIQLVAPGAGLRALAGGPPLILALTFLFLWWRVAALTSRDLSFFAVGMSFRFGMLVTLVGCALVALRGAPASADGQALACLLLYFACGLTAAALARIDDKAFTADQSRGALLPWPRFVQLLALVAATLGLALLAAHIAAPDSLARLFGWLAPVAGLAGTLLLVLLAGLIWLMTPLLRVLGDLLARLLDRPLNPAATEAFALPPAGEAVSMTELLAGSPLLQGLLIGGGAVVALLLIALFFARTFESMLRDEAEEATPEPPEVGATPRLRRPGLWGLARRYGMGRRLLAAVSVQNLYANVARLARRRGYPRPPATPPDLYLPLLAQAFPGHEAALAQLTDAYMRVHYGDIPVAPGELAALRAAYDALRTAHDPQRTTHDPQRTAP